MRCIGVLLAAGRGRRMGGNKQFHIVQTPDGEKQLVAAAFDTIAPVCETMFVVLGHRADEVAAILEDRKFEIVLSDPDAPMFDSIRAGLRAVNSRRATLAGDAGDLPSILLQLGDHSSLNVTTLDQIIAVAAENPGKAIMPTYQGNGGHPVLIPITIAEQILNTPCPDGLRGFWQEHSEVSLRIDVDDSGVIKDIDTI